MVRITRRDASAIVLVALVCALASIVPPFNLIHGWSIDALTTLRWHAFGPRRDPAASPVVVVAIDEETYRTPPFKGSPTVTWTSEIGRVLNAVIDGGAKVVGFDIVFPTSIEQSEIPFGGDLLGGRMRGFDIVFPTSIDQSEIPFGGALLGGRMRGFDRDFLRALAKGAAAGKVVLGEQLGGDGASPGQR